MIAAIYGAMRSDRDFYVRLTREVKSLRSAVRPMLKCMRSGRSIAKRSYRALVTQATQRVHKAQSFRIGSLVLMLAEQNNDG